MMHVAELRIYPVKGFRGCSVQHAVVESWGLAGDRRYLVVDAAWRFLTQRDVPRMATIEAVLTPGGLELAAESRPRMPVSEPGPDVATVDVTVWRDRVMARDAGDAAATWLTSALGVACRLVHMPHPQTARPVDPDFAQAGDHVSFADGFPLLVTSTGSLEDLNARLDLPVGMDRFRTNVAVSGAEPWAEDGWRHLRIGGVSFVGAKDCARCVVTTIDQDRGETSPDVEPLRTLSRFRRKAGGRVVFGLNLIPRGLGRVTVGDEVTG